MASLHVRNVDDSLVSRLKQRAVQNGRSAEAEHREILRSALTRDDDDRQFWEQAAAIRERTRGRPQTPSEVLQREGRDER